MKYVLIFSLLSSTYIYGDTDNLELRVKALEQTVRKLQQIHSSQSTLREKDLGNKTIDSIQHRTSASSGGSENISDTKRKEIMKQLEAFKTKSDQRTEFLDKLLNE